MEQKVELEQQETRRLRKELESEKVDMKISCHWIRNLFWYEGVFIGMMSALHPGAMLMLFWLDYRISYWYNKCLDFNWLNTLGPKNEEKFYSLYAAWLSN